MWTINFGKVEIKPYICSINLINIYSTRMKNLLKKSTFSILLCLSMIALATPANAQRREKVNVIKYFDQSQQKDSVIQDVSLRLRYLYTDSMYVGLENIMPDGSVIWIPQKDIDFFYYYNTLYSAKTLIMDDGQPHRVFMAIDRNKKSDIKIYTYGSGINKRMYAEGPDSIMQEIDDVKTYRMEERVRRSGNPNYYRRFKWGVTAGMYSNTFKSNHYGGFDNQAVVTGGVWADIPFDAFGLSIRPSLLYTEFSGKGEEQHSSLAFNYKAICMPLTLRYSFIMINSRLVPFIEGGAEMRYYLRHDMSALMSLIDTYQGSYYAVWNDHGKSPFNLATTLGAGFEYRLNDQHSLWLNINYNLSRKIDSYNSELYNMFIDVNMSNLMLSISYNL